MPSYAQYCPVAKASETLGDRWTVLIVREMLGGASGFNELQRGLPGISRSVLTDRMRALERAKVIERRTGPKGRTLEYRLTPAGRDLKPVVQAIGEWGATWSLTEPRPEELDPYLLIVWMARHVDHQRLPPNRTVVQFDFRDPKRRYWMVLEPSEVSVCLQHPGFDVDLEVIVDTATLYRVYLGRAELGGAIRAGQLTMSGPRTLQRGFGHWFTWSAFAPASRSAQERRTAASRLASPQRVRIADDSDPGTAPCLAATPVRRSRVGACRWCRWARSTPTSSRACWRTRSSVTRSGSATLMACADASRRGSRDALDGDERWLNWVVRERADGRALGWVQATVRDQAASIAYALLAAERRSGAASDAVRAMIRWLRAELGVTDLTASIAPTNQASAQVARAVGFEPTDRRDAGEIVWVANRAPHVGP